MTALVSREEDFSRGLEALLRISDAKCFLCEPEDQPFSGEVPASFKRLRIGTVRPQSLARIQVHRHFPAKTDAPVWDIHAKDIAYLGALLETGYLSATRLVAITGDALREPRLVRCQPGADLRGLSQNLMRPGPHDVMSEPTLGARRAHWLGPRDRQVTVLERAEKPRKQHWFSAALERAARQAPLFQPPPSISGLAACYRLRQWCAPLPLATP